MKRREAKFVHASPRLAPSQIEGTLRPRETPMRPAGKGRRAIVSRAVTAAKTVRGRS